MNERGNKSQNTTVRAPGPRAGSRRSSPSSFPCGHLPPTFASHEHSSQEGAHTRDGAEQSQKRLPAPATPATSPKTAPGLTTEVFGRLPSRDRQRRPPRAAQGAFLASQRNCSRTVDSSMCPALPACPFQVLPQLSTSRNSPGGAGPGTSWAPLKQETGHQQGAGVVRNNPVGWQLCATHLLSLGRDLPLPKRRKLFLSKTFSPLPRPAGPADTPKRHRHHPTSTSIPESRTPCCRSSSRG